MYMKIDFYLNCDISVPGIEAATTKKLIKALALSLIHAVPTRGIQHPALTKVLEYMMRGVIHFFKDVTNTL